MRKLSAAILLGVLLGAPRPAAADAPEVTPAFRADIMTMMKMTGADALGLQMGTYMSNAMIEMLNTQRPELTEATVAAIKEEISKVMEQEIPSMMEEVVPVYAAHFTQSEVKALIAFYKTPLGAKLVRETPAVVQECMLRGQAWGQRIQPKITARVQARLESESSKKK